MAMMMRVKLLRPFSVGLTGEYFEANEGYTLVPRKYKDILPSTAKVLEEDYDEEENTIEVPTPNGTVHMTMRQLGEAAAKAMMKPTEGVEAEEPKEATPDAPEQS